MSSGSIEKNGANPPHGQVLRHLHVQPVLSTRSGIAQLSVPPVAWTLTLHVHDSINDVYAVLGVCPSVRPVCIMYLLLLL